MGLRTSQFKLAGATLIALCLFMGEVSLGAANKCGGIFYKKLKVTAPLQEKIDSTIKSFAELRINIDTTQVQRADSIEFTALKNNYIQKEKVFADYLEANGIMTRDDLVDKIKLAVVDAQASANRNKDKSLKDQEITERKRKTQAATLSSIGGSGDIMAFRRVKPGKFLMGKPGEAVRVEIAEPFQMMATPTTQFMWAQVFDLAREKLGVSPRYNRHYSLKIDDLNPIDGMSYEQVQNWIDHLNQLSVAGEAGLKSLIPSFKKGDHFRLPTEAEWEFVIRLRGKSPGAYHFGDDSVKLNTYAWTKDNSQGQVQNVATRMPLVIDGQTFFDMHGNVAEFVLDKWRDKITGGKDKSTKPKIPLPGTGKSLPPVFITVRGGSFLAPVNSLEHESYFRQGLSSKMKSTGLGFRLVREVRR